MINKHEFGEIDFFMLNMDQRDVKARNAKKRNQRIKNKSKDIKDKNKGKIIVGIQAPASEHYPMDINARGRNKVAVSKSQIGHSAEMSGKHKYPYRHKYPY
jgi:hypothetical protein